jgi:hypothetical protein
MALSLSDIQAGYGGSRFTSAVAVVTNDAVDLAVIALGLFVTAAGNVKVTMADGTIVTFSSLASQYHPIVVKRVWATGTTSTGIIALS